MMLRFPILKPTVHISHTWTPRKISTRSVNLRQQNLVITPTFLHMLMKIQPDATVSRYLFTAKSLYMFRVSQHPSSGVLKIVTAASGTGHNSGTATSLQRGLIRPIRPCWREVAVPVLRPVLEAAVTVFSTPDDGCCDTRNMYSVFAVNKYLLTVASGWIFINIELQCIEPCA